MIRILTTSAAVLLLLACGEDPAPIPTPPPDSGSGSASVPASVAKDRGPFSLRARCGVPGFAPPVLLTGDARDVTVTVHRVEDFPAPPSGEPLHSGPAKRNAWYFLPPLPTGFYRVTARRGEEAVSCRLVVSDLAVVVTRARREALVFVADAKTGRPVASATVILEAGETTRKGDTDVSGVFRTDVPPAPVLLTRVRKGDRIGRVETAGLAGGELVAWLGTDKPAHAPGEIVHVAGIYRARNGDYRAADAKNLRIEIRDERGSVVAAAEPEVREPGFFSGSIRIPPDPPPGPLTLAAGDAGAHPLVLAGALATGFAVHLDAPDEIEVGQEAGFEVRASGADGRTPPGDVFYEVESRHRGLVKISLTGRGRMLPGEPFRAEFTPDTPGQVTIRVRVRDDETGLEVHRARTIRCIGEDSPTPGEAPGGLRLAAVPADVAPGEPIRLALHLPPALADATVLTTMEAGSLGPHAVEVVEGTGHEYEVEAPDRPGRTVRFEAYVVHNREVHRAEAVVRIRAESRRLPVTIDFEPAEPEPGTPTDLVLKSPADGRAVVTVHEDIGRPAAPPIEQVFYGDRADGGTWSDSLAFASDSAVGELPGTGPVPEPTGVERSPAPVLWRADLRLEEGRAVVPLTLPPSPHRFRIVVTVVASNHRFGTATRAVRWPEPLEPEPGDPPDAPDGTDDPLDGIRQAAFWARPLAPAVSRGQFDLPGDATDAQLTIAVTRGPFSAAIRSLPTEESASTETSDEAVLAFVPAAVARTIDPAAADRAGYSEAVVTRLALRATARLYARQADAGGFGPRDGVAPDAFTTARVVRSLVRARIAGMPVDEDRVQRAADWLATLDAKSKEGAPVLTPAERMAIALTGRLSRPGATVDESVRADMRFLLDRREGPAWGDPRTTTAAALALLEIRRLTGPTDEEPLPIRIRVGSALVAAVTLSPEELAAGGRVFTVGPDHLATGPIAITFEAGPAVRADIAARLSWWGSATKAPVRDR